MAFERQSGAQGAPAATQQQIAAAQERLADHGFDPGVRHGQMDWSTRTSIQGFQRAKGLPVSGVVDGPTNTALHGVPKSPRGTRTGRVRGGIEGVGPGGASPMPAILHSSAGGASTGAPQHAASNARVNAQPLNAGTINMNRGLVSTGFRAPLLFSQSLAASVVGVAVVAKPQMDFRGENLVVDSTVVGPNCSISMPTVGSIPQIIGGGASTTVPGTLFSPNQCGALDFEMAIAQQGNDITILVTNSTAATLAFACALFGHQTQAGDSAMAATGGVLPAGGYRGR